VVGEGTGGGSGFAGASFGGGPLSASSVASFGWLGSTSEGAAGGALCGSGNTSFGSMASAATSAAASVNSRQSR